MNFKNKKLWIAVLICSTVIAAFSNAIFLMMQSSSIFSKEIEYIRKDIYIVVNKYGVNETLYLDINQWYCKYAVFYGGSNPFPWDLAYPRAQIAFFFLEDLNQTLADNYSDTIIRMNPVNGTIDDPSCGMKMCCVFFCEGSCEKFIYYKDMLLFHYVWTGPETTKYYDIKLIDLEGDC